MSANDKPAWRQMPSGDWAYERQDGGGAVRLGSVVYQDMPGGRVWYSVSCAKEHGPEEGGLSECKRRLEALWG